MDSLKAEIENSKQEEAELQGGTGSGTFNDMAKQLTDKISSDETQFNQKYNSILEKKNLMRKKFDEEIRTKKEEF